MAELAVVRGAVGAWLATLIAAMVALLTAGVLPRWVKVSADVVEADVGLWQTCRRYGSTYNCTTLNSWSTAGQRLQGFLSVAEALQLVARPSAWIR